MTLLYAVPGHIKWLRSLLEIALEASPFPVSPLSHGLLRKYLVAAELIHHFLPRTQTTCVNNYA